MKKLIALLLALAMAVSLIACGGKTKNGDSENNQGQTPEKPGEEEKEISFTPMVVVDNDECAITITSIGPDNYHDYACFMLKVQVENKSADKSYKFQVESAAINGVQCSPAVAPAADFGASANDYIMNIAFLDRDFEGVEIGDYTDIELTFLVHPAQPGWQREEEGIVRKTVHVYPYGQEKAEKFVREPQASDTVIMDNEDVTATVISCGKDEIWGDYAVNLFLVNKTDKEVMFSVSDASINGYMADSIFMPSVSAGKCAFGSITWLNTTLEENRIVEVENIEFNLQAYDQDDLMNDDIAKQTVILNP